MCMNISNLNVNKLRTELLTCHILSEQRCLRKACEWAEDLVFCLPEEGEEKVLDKLEQELNDPTAHFNPLYEHARACFDNHEYDRAADIVRIQVDNDKSRFLHYFSMYKAAEKKRINLMKEVDINIPKKAQLKFDELRDSIERSMEKREPDGWLLYVYALVLHKFKLYERAIDTLEASIKATPINWSAWHLLATMIDSKRQLHWLELPNHMFRVFFYYVCRLDLHIPDSDFWVFVGLKDTKIFLDKYFKKSIFIRTALARSMASQPNQHKEAIELFKEIRAEDPYRVDAMDVYSNLLYVSKQKKELAKLAYEIERVDPNTSEANSCVANSYSAREQHTKAIVYFTRSLRLNPDHLNSWTLIGHEYLEMKSIDKALQAYRFATSINKRDCRAWLGLGNTYETIASASNNPNFETCLYYYSQVGKYRPKDPIMFTAMGGIYERMGDVKEANLCYKQVEKETQQLKE